MFNRRFLNIIALVCVILNITCGPTIIFNSSENIQDIINTDSNGEKSYEFPETEKFFPFGTNIVWDWIWGLSDRQGITMSEWIETALNDMQAHHINTIHFNNLYYDDPQGHGLDLFVSLAEERGIRLFPQAGKSPYYFPYWLATKAERDNYFENQAKPAYAAFIDQYKDSDTILVWSVMEEPNPSSIPTIISELKNWTDYVEGLDPNHPAVVTYFRDDAVQQAKDIIKPRVLPTDIYPFYNYAGLGPITPTGQLYLYDDRTYTRYVAARESGAPLWVLAQAFKCYNAPSGYWTWRFPTPNEMHWQAWLALVNGAKGLIYWTYTSNAYDTGGNTIYGLVDRDGNPTQLWDAVADVWYEIEPFTKIILDIDESETSIISSMEGEIRARTFQRSTGTERYIIVVNTDVVNSKKINLELTSSENIYDLRTLEQITSDELFNHVLLPGRGNIYLVGSVDDLNNYLDEYVRDNDSGNDNDTDTSKPEYAFNFYFLLLLFSVLISLVLIIIKRRLSPKRHKHKSYSYKY